MSVEENKAVVRRWNEEIFSSGDLRRLEEVYDTNCTIPRWQLKGIDQVRAAFAEVFAKNPGAKATVEEMIAEGDKVVARITHSKDGKPLYEGVAIYRLTDGKIVDDWYVGTEISE